MPQFRFVDDVVPQRKFRFVDSVADAQTATVMWAGQPVTMDAIKRVADDNGTTPDAIMYMGTDVGQFETNFAGTALGQGVLRAGQGIENVASSIVGGIAKASGYDSIYDRVQQDKKRRDDFLSFVEKGGDTEAMLGPRGSRIYGQVMQSVGQAGTAAVVAGPVGAYSQAINDAWLDGLDDAKAQGLSGLDSIGHAGRSATIEGGITYLMSRIPGIKTLEESFSPAAKNEVKNFLRSPSMREKMKAAARELGGWTAEGAEEMMIAAGKQSNDMSLGTRKDMDWMEVLEAGATGVAGRASVGAYKGLNDELKRYEAKLPDIVKGLRAAEIDLERKINPLEALEVLAKTKGRVTAEDFEKHFGHKDMTPAARDSYRDAMEFYVNEARQNGKVGAMETLETDLKNLRKEQRDAVERRLTLKQKAAEAKAKGKPVPIALSQELQQEPKTINERAEFSLKDFEARIAPPPAETVQAVDPHINPYIMAPWETETRAQRRIRVLSRDLAGAKEKIKGLRSALVTNKRLTKAQQDSALELVRQEVPRADQWKFSKNILDATRPRLVDKLLSRIEKHTNDHDHRLAVDELAESFNKAKNLRKEFGELVQGVRRSVDLKKFNSKVAAEAIRNWADENPDALLTKQDADAIERLSKTNVSQMAPDDIRGLAAYIESLAYESASKDRLIGFMESASVRDTGDLIAQQAAKVEPLEMKSDSVFQNKLASGDLSETDRTFTSQVMHEIAERPEVTLARISPELTNRLYGEVRAARGRFKSRVKATTETLSATFNALGLTHESTIQASLKQFAGQPGTELESWREQKRKINGVELTRGEALQLVRWLDDPIAAKSLLNSGVELSNDRSFGPLDSDLLLQLSEFVGESGMRVKDTMFEHDNTYVIDGVNSANERMTGRVLTDKRNVVPIVRADVDYQQLLTAGRSGIGMREALADSYGHLKHREGGDSKLKIPDGMDAVDMFMKHAERMHRFAEYGVPARNAELLLNNPTTKDTIVRTNGKQGYDHIVNSVRAEVAGFDVTDPTTRSLARWNAAVAGATIAGKLTVMAAQPLDTITAAAYNENGFSDLAAGLQEGTNRNPQSIRAEMYEVLGPNSGEFWSRNQSDNYAGEVTSGQFKRRGYFRPPSVLQHGFRPLNEAEFYGAQMPNYLAAKAAARRQFGLADDDFRAYATNPDWLKFIVSRWESDVYRGSNSSDGMELPAALQYAKTNPAAGLIMNFYNTASKVYSLFSAGKSALDARDYSTASRFLGAAVASSIMFAALQEALSLGEKDKEKNGFLKRAGLRMVANTVGLHPMGGQIVADQLVRPMMGLESYDSNPILLIDKITKTAQGTGTIVGQLTGIADKQLEPDKMLKKWSNLVSDAGSLLALPTPAAIDYTRRAARFIEDGTLLPGLASPKKQSKPTKLKAPGRRRATSPYGR